MNGYDILPPKENFKGMSYGEWSAEWWKWLLGSENPDLFERRSGAFSQRCF